MRIGSAIAIYFVIWWVVLFAVLPFGVRNAHETGENVSEGHEPGAPVRPRLMQKVVITTAVAGVVFAFVYWVLVSGLLLS